MQRNPWQFLSSLISNVETRCTLLVINSYIYLGYHWIFTSNMNFLIMNKIRMRSVKFLKQMVSFPRLEICPIGWFALNFLLKL